MQILASLVYIRNTNDRERETERGRERKGGRYDLPPTRTITPSSVLSVRKRLFRYTGQSSAPGGATTKKQNTQKTCSVS